jgi:hypothetical protein
VNWRAVLAVLASLLLSLPLVLLLGGVLRPGLPEVGPGGRPISPVLTTEERMRLATYRHECGLSSECEPPLGCVMEARARRQYCTDSQCTTDAQCPEGQICRDIASSGDGPWVRFCLPVGVRQEGEHCLQLPETREAACAPGLRCGGKDGWCARPCQKGASAACPEGFFCADTEPEPLCLPTCEVRGCPPGQHCIRYGEGTSVCAEMFGPPCQQTPCPRGGECQVGHDSTRPGKVWLECVERCGESHPPCSAGLICDAWLCRAPCDPHAPHPCREGYLCKQHMPDRPYACQPDW